MTKKSFLNFLGRSYGYFVDHPASLSLSMKNTTIWTRKTRTCMNFPWSTYSFCLHTPDVFRLLILSTFAKTMEKVKVFTEINQNTSIWNNVLQWIIWTSLVEYLLLRCPFVKPVIGMSSSTTRWRCRFTVI